MMKVLSVLDREALTFKQIKAVEGALTREFSNLPAGEVHREVVRVSEGLLARAHFTDHVAVLTGRFVAERLDAAAALAAVAP